MYSLTTTCIRAEAGGSIAVLTQVIGIITVRLLIIIIIKSIPSTSSGISSTLGNTKIRYKNSWFTDDLRAAMVYNPSSACTCA